MPRLNTALLLSGRGPDVVDPQETEARGMSLRQMAQAQQMQDLQFTEAQRRLKEQEQLRGIFAQNANNPDQLLNAVRGVNPELAITLEKHRTDAAKATADLQKSQLENSQVRMNQLSGVLGTVRDEQTYRAAVGMAHRRKLLDDAEAQAYLARPWDAETQAHVAQLRDQSLNWLQQQEQSRAAEAAKQATEKQAATLPGERAKAEQAQLQTAGGINNQDAYTAWRSKLTPELQARTPAMFSPAAVAAIDRMSMSSAERSAAADRAATREMTAGHNAATEKLGIAQLGVSRARLRLAEKTAAQEGNPQLTEAVMQNPMLYDGLTPSARTAIAPDLARRGFSQFGKQLSESAIDKLSAARSAVASLQDLRVVLKDNEQYIGPISGVQSINPWSDAKKAQADIDRVKQRVGKTLEGGVLRKEDEEKYKKILATLFDTPGTAIYKVDQLIEDITRDREIFEQEQRAAGRKVNTPGTPAPARVEPSAIRVKGAPPVTGRPKPPLSAFERQ